MMENQTTINNSQEVFRFSLRELTEAYAPERVCHRDEQIREISNLFQSFKDHQTEMCSNLLIQGFSGTGKTTVISHILKENPGTFFFASGADCQTAFSLFKGLFNISGSTLEHIFVRVKEELKKTPRIIIVDEINKLRNLNEIKIFFDKLNSLYRETLCPIVIITNKRGLMGLMPDDARLTFHFERIDFNPYEYQEICDILKDRIRLIQSRHSEIQTKDEDLMYLSVFVQQNFDGSVRSALNLVRKCIIANDFSEEALRSSCEKIVMEDWTRELKTLSFHQRKFLIHLCFLVNESSNGEVKFQRFVEELEYSPGRISQILSFFENFGIIKSKNINRGRAGGNSRFISFASPRHYKIIKEVLL